MKPASWMRASFYVSLFTCIIAVGAVLVLSNRFEKLSKAAATPVGQPSADFDDLRVRVDDARTKLNSLIGHTEDRHVTALRTIRSLGGKKFILVLGDNITEAAELPERLCGFPVINAGIGGSRVSDFIPFVEDIFSSLTTPTVTVVALGINDTQSRYWNKSKERQFKASYDLLLSMLPPNTMLTSLTPIDTLQETGKRFSPVAWSTINLAIKDAAARRSATLINVSSIVIASATLDGVHLIGPSSDSWREKLTDAIKTKLGCES